MFVYDNDFLLAEDIQRLDNLIKDNNNQWIYSPLTIPENHQNMVQTVSKGNWGDMEYFIFSPPANSPANNEIIYMINKFANKHNIEYKSIDRIMVNFTPGHSKRIGMPHVDNKTPHLVFLYYLEDSDGETVVYNEKYNGIKQENVTIMKKIMPKKGSAFIMDGLHFHSITPPISGLRKVINANLLY